ncbi:hypothetical protein EC973_003116 [Apophysomyces ossiformis]|uniref:Uncharacterized protein n=1 Tax=Apophysomyces ossiformis TaxID=679940 RepID=A0A8H7EM66_9FUNG|nr:hypothetical protein EC973_003116 [Apophysomyces ossiformis]
MRQPKNIALLLCGAITTLNDPRSVVYPIRVRQTAHVEDGPTVGTVFWNRDVNAGKNIRCTLVRYMESDHDLGSRPESLQRGTRSEQEPTYLEN